MSEVKAMLMPDDVMCVPPAHMMWIVRHYDKVLMRDCSWSPIIHSQARRLEEEIYSSYLTIHREDEWMFRVYFIIYNGGTLVYYTNMDIPLSKLWVVPYAFNRADYISIMEFEYHKLCLIPERWNELAFLGFVESFDISKIELTSEIRSFKILTDED